MLSVFVSVIQALAILLNGVHDLNHLLYCYTCVTGFLVKEL